VLAGDQQSIDADFRHLAEPDDVRLTPISLFEDDTSSDDEHLDGPTTRRPSS
jgi:hypothetical protein